MWIVVVTHDNGDVFLWGGFYEEEDARDWAKEKIVGYTDSLPIVKLRTP